MRNTMGKSGACGESYILEIDGTVKSVYGLFVDALKAAIQLKQRFPYSNVKVHDANEQLTQH